MKTLFIQYSFNGPKWELWNTNVETINEAWEELDDRHLITDGATLYYGDEIMTINGGFQ
jgi:hypothetical protein